MEEMILDRADELCACEEFGAILFQPEDLCQRIARVHGAACAFIERAAECGFRFLQRTHDARTAAVCPRLHIRERLLLRIERDQAVHDCTECDAGWYPPLMAERIRRLAHNLLRRRKDLRWAFLRPVRMRRAQWIECLSRRATHPRRLVRDRTYARCSDIHADPYALFFHTVHRAAFL